VRREASGGAVCDDAIGAARTTIDRGIFMTAPTCERPQAGTSQNKAAGPSCAEKAEREQADTTPV
jgi:hypothetical protein